MKGDAYIVRQLLQKAKDAALMAIEYYNKPAVTFKSEGFIVMMCIAWTSFFHAYFFKNKIKPFYRKKENGKRPRFETTIEKLPNGKEIKEKRWWDLSKCVKEFFKTNSDIGVQKNIEFLSQLRNMIVHRNIPELDTVIFAECQACVLNFNDYLRKYFGGKHGVDVFLSFSIQLFNSPRNFLDASQKELKSKNATEIVEFIKAFRSSLDTNVFESPQYSFKAVLIQVKNHASKDALALRFIHEKDLDDEQKQTLKNIGIVLIKEKEKKVDDVPENYTLTYRNLIKELKKEIPSFKENNHFRIIKSEILEKFSNLIHTRRLDPKNPKSSKKDFYDPKIIEKFKERYNSSTSNTVE